MTAADRLTDMADAAALTRAVRDGDREGREAILAAGDAEAIALALSHILAAIARLIDSRSDGLSLIDGWQADLRAAMAADHDDGR